MISCVSISMTHTFHFKHNHLSCWLYKNANQSSFKKKRKTLHYRNLTVNPGKVKLRYIFAEKKIATTVKHKAVSALLGAI